MVTFVLYALLYAQGSSKTWIKEGMEKLKSDDHQRLARYDEVAFLSDILTLC